MVFALKSEKKIDHKDANMIETLVSEYYARKFEKFGATPQGVDWKNTDAQWIRFMQLSQLFDPDLDTNKVFSINDLGCGYAEFYKLLDLKFKDRFEYFGYDISKPCIDFLNTEETNRQKKNFNAIHVQKAEDMRISDYSITSGIFNVKFESNNDLWLKYILRTLDTLNEKSTKGFAFNCLTSYSDKDKMQDNLYYADSLFLFDYVKKNHSKNVALYHDYGLYDFTIIVRKG